MPGPTLQALAVGLPRVLVNGSCQGPIGNNAPEPTPGLDADHPHRARETGGPGGRRKVASFDRAVDIDSRVSGSLSAAAIVERVKHCRP